MFCHHGYVFVFKIDNSGRFQNFRSISRTCFMEIDDFKWSSWKFACGLGLGGYTSGQKHVKCEIAYTSEQKKRQNKFEPNWSESLWYEQTFYHPPKPPKPIV